MWLRVRSAGWGMASHAGEQAWPAWLASLAGQTPGQLGPLAEEPRWPAGLDRLAGQDAWPGEMASVADNISKPAKKNLGIQKAGFFSNKDLL